MQSILPDIQACLICEDVRQEINGMQTVVGVLNFLPAPALPLTLIKICVWTRWCGGVGVFEQHTRILTPDDRRTVGESRVRFQLREMEHSATNVHCFGGLQFQEYGMHHVEIQLEGELKMRFALPVIEVRPQGNMAS